MSVTIEMNPIRVHKRKVKASAAGAQTRRQFLADSALALTAAAAAPLPFRRRRLVIDTHVEFWTSDPRYPFHHPEHPEIKRQPVDAPVENYIPQMKEFGVKYAVIINPRFYGWDNSYISHCLRSHPDVFVAHGLINPEDPNVADRLRYWVTEHGFQGMRLSPIYHPKSTWLNSKAHYGLWRTAEELGVCFNFFIAPHQMAMLEDMAGRFPGVKIVVDHTGMPDISHGFPRSDLREIFRLKKFPQVWISSSEPYGMSSGKFPYEDTLPVFRAVYEEFGGKQLVWGTGYPRPRWELPMDKELEFVDRVCAFYSAEDRELMLGRNALRIWKFPATGG